MVKKKYHFGLGVLLVLLFLMLLGCFSSTYAYMSSDYLDYGIDTLYDNAIDPYYNTQLKNILNALSSNSTAKINILEHFNTQLDTWGIPNITDDNIIGYVSIDSNTSYITMKIFVFNNSSPNGYNNLDFFYFDPLNNSVYSASATSSDYFYQLNFRVNYNNNNITISDYVPYSINNTNLSYVYFRGNLSATADDPYILNAGNFFACGVPLGYAKLPLVAYGTKQVCIFKDYNGNYQLPTPTPTSTPIVTPEPTSTPSSGGSIDYTQNLENINNSINTQGVNIVNQISGDTQKLIDNQNLNTEQIVNAVNSANENYWGNSGDLNIYDHEDSISSNLDSLMSDMSGDLLRNEALSSIQEAEEHFLGLFDSSQEESNLDLKFTWNDFSYNGVVLIPQGSLNISQLCRDNQQLGYIQSLIRMVFNFEVGLTLIYQIWNLILATLGIDNPYLYEDYDGVERINTYTGEVHSTLVRRKRYYRKGGK